MTNADGEVEPAPVPSWEASADVVVIGSGVAGLTSALEAVRLGLRTLVVTKSYAYEGNTRWAQGGIAVVRADERDEGDSIRRHVDDTLLAGAGLCDPEAVATILGDGPAAVEALRELGARFDVDASGSLARAREGGHTAFRVIHAGGDATGAEVERALLEGVRGRSIPVLECQTVVDILRTPEGAAGGVLLLGPRSASAGMPTDSPGDFPDGSVDGSSRGSTEESADVLGVVRAPAVILATGGLGQLYQATTNPDVATADGIALALRAGASVADVEFVQFHPTVLYTGPQAAGRRPLVTEAVRGEGAVLIDATGAPVMAGVHPLGDLAPRDVVSAAIIRRLAQAPGGVDDHVYLDATHLSAQAFQARFPTVYTACVAASIDPSTEPIPVAPAAHFGCGGVVTTVDGRTEVTGVYAAGEVARTGLHGANRLASNSLLEGLVVGRRAARAVAEDLEQGHLAARRDLAVSSVTVPTLTVARRSTLQRVMSRHVAIGRDAAGLAVAEEALDATGTTKRVTTRRDVEDAALEMAARAIIVAAHERTESRGCHVRNDFRDTDDERWRASLVVRLDDEGRVALADRVSAGCGSSC
jgi:L-aspartate oxidase